MRQRSIWMLTFLIWACEGLFDTTPTDEGSIFALQVEHNITRLVDSAVVQLSWTEITIENFSKFTVERRKEGNTIWILRATLTNPLHTSYQDMVNDDVVYRYRISIIDIQDNAKWTEGEASIPKTTSLFIPADFNSIQKAFNSPVIDDGDSILVAPGIYHGSIAILGKNVLVQALDGYKVTTLIASVSQRCVNINDGILEGFRLKGGVSGRGSGGGIFASGIATLRKNFIIDNYASRLGGGVYFTDNVNLFNNIIFNNSSGSGGGGLYANNTIGMVINNTVVGNDVDGLVIAGGTLTLLNNIFYGHIGSDIAFSDSITAHSSEIEYSLFKESNFMGGENISGNPAFFNASGEDFHLQPTSICINAGHPGEEYRDQDGSRNDMGAFGGPGGIE